MTVQDYRDLVVWQKGVDFVTKIYRTTADFPREEIYALTNQMRRAAVSIPCNVAEGHARGSTKEFLQFLGFASGSLRELETQIVIAQRLGYLADINSDDLMNRAAELAKMLSGLIKSLRRKLA